MEGDVDPTRDRDLTAEEALGCSGVVVQAVAHVARLPAGVADRVAGVGDLELGQLLDVRVDDGGERAQQPRAFGRRHVAPCAERLLGAPDRCVGLLDARGADLGDRLAGDRVDHRWLTCSPAHILSKVRSSSQSVTAESNAFSSTSAMLT